MCGICGILNFDTEREVDVSILEKMAAAMVHRGPDDQGFYLKRNVGLGHRRLSIIDLEGGHQPISNEDGSVWIVFNGEIYNYLEIHDELTAKGHIFKTRSDTETIIHAYEEFDVECLKKLRGMFAFAIWDEKRKRLFAARDRIGKKPFYYVQADHSFLFGSEIKSLLEHPRVVREVDTTALDLYLSLRYVPGPLTMFKNVQKLQPAHYLILDRERISTIRYWDLQREGRENGRRKEDCFEEFLSLLSESTRMRLMSEVPLGVFLSGGLDSSLVVALLSGMRDTPINTFSVGYEKDFGTNEFHFAKLIAERFRTHHRELRIGPKDFYDFIPRLVWHLDEPISDPATIPLFFLSEFAKQWVTVILSGEGADEILGGYYIYRKMLLIEKFRRLPAALGYGAMLRILKKLVKREKTRKYLGWASSSLSERYHGVSQSFSPESKNRILKGSNSLNENLEKFFEPHYEHAKAWPDLEKMLYVDLMIWLPDDLLMKADKMTMAAAMELRVPFLDHKLVELAFSLPSEFKINGNSTKVLLREIGKEMLPAAIIKREKRGFPVPLRNWLKQDLKKLTEETLLQPDSSCQSFLEKKEIELLLKRHIEQQEDLTEQIWNLLVFEFWHRTFMKPKIVSERP